MYDTAYYPFSASPFPERLLSIDTVSAVVIQTPYSPYQDFSVVARINISSGLVVSLLFNRSEADLDDFLQRLRLRRKETHQCPLSVLAILFEGYGYTSEEWRRKLDGDVVSLEVRTGMTSLDTSHRGYALHISEYERMIRDLHACNTNLIFLADVLNFEVEFGSFCGRLFDLLEELRERTGNEKFHTAQAKDEFRQHLAYCMNSSRFRQNQIQALKMRVQSQINLVSSYSSRNMLYLFRKLFNYDQMYSLISQRDSRINIMIAEDSKRVAEAVQQDSRTMKTIALMTLIFLPGTLIAVSPSAQTL